MSDCIETAILNAIDTKLRELTWAKFITTDKIKVNASDFLEHEIPAIQVYDVGGYAQQQMGHTQNSWLLAIEILIKPTAEGYADNRTLMNYRRDLIAKLGENPQLVNMAGMIHIQYNDFINDLHLLSPFYLTRTTWEAIYLAPFADGC